MTEDGILGFEYGKERVAKLRALYEGLSVGPLGGSLIMMPPLVLPVFKIEPGALQPLFEKKSPPEIESATQFHILQQSESKHPAPEDVRVILEIEWPAYDLRRVLVIPWENYGPMLELVIDNGVLGLTDKPKIELDRVVTVTDMPLETLYIARRRLARPGG